MLSKITQSPSSRYLNKFLLKLANELDWIKWEGREFHARQADVRKDELKIAVR